MSRSWWWRTLMILLIVGYAVYYLIPSWVYFRLPGRQAQRRRAAGRLTPHWAPKKHLNLGLDLQGGIELVMGVDADKAMRDKAVRRADDLKRLATDKKLPFKDIRRAGQPRSSWSATARPRPRRIGDMALEQYTDSFRCSAARAGTRRARLPGGLGRRSRRTTPSSRRSSPAQPHRQVGRERGRDQAAPRLGRHPDPAAGLQGPRARQELLGQTAQLEFKMADEDDRSLAKFEHELPERHHYAPTAPTLRLLAGPQAARDLPRPARRPPTTSTASRRSRSSRRTTKAAPCTVPYYKTITLHSKVEVTGDRADRRPRADRQPGRHAEAGGGLHARQGGRRQVLRPLGPTSASGWRSSSTAWSSRRR
jgi:preprotein translocase subunit SecD